MDKRKRERSATILLYKSILDLYGKEYFSKIKIKFSTGNGVYFESGFDIDEEFLAKISNKMKNFIKADLPIKKKSIKIIDLIKIFEDMNCKDRVRLLNTQTHSYVYIHEFEDYIDYFYGSLAKSTASIGDFKLEKYKQGFVLIIPNIDGKEAEDFKADDNIFEKLIEDDKYLSNLGIENVSDINNFLIKQKTADLILIQEAYIEKKITDLVDRILKRKTLKFIMIAGPSSSGKTTFSKKLAIHLKANGINAHTIAVDNYFKNREDTPKNSDGMYDFESINALDIEKFNEDMLNLIEGRKVELPSYNFIKGKREYKNDFLSLNENDLLIIEGIHCLNDEISYKLDKNLKFKIYISALSSLNIDTHNRIATTDLRLIRRLIRDSRTRGINPKETIQMWDNVRRGEEKYIFPYQKDADLVFNSALCYELPVLKTYALPLLFSISKDEPEYERANRLIRFLDYFLAIPADIIPNNSIIKEFIGGSCFNI